ATTRATLIAPSLPPVLIPDSRWAPVNCLWSSASDCPPKSAGSRTRGRQVRNGSRSQRNRATLRKHCARNSPGPSRASPSSWNWTGSAMTEHNELLALRCDQRQRWQQGERILVEAYLERHSALSTDPEAVLDLIYSEIVLREEQGDRPRLEE